MLLPPWQVVHTYKSIHITMLRENNDGMNIKHDWLKISLLSSFFLVFFFNQHFYPFVQVITSGNSVVPSIRFLNDGIFLFFLVIVEERGGGCTGTDAGPHSAFAVRVTQIISTRTLYTFPLDCVSNRYNASLKIVRSKRKFFLNLLSTGLSWPCDSRVSSFDIYSWTRSSPCFRNLACTCSQLCRRRLVYSCIFSCASHAGNPSDPSYQWRHHGKRERSVFFSYCPRVTFGQQQHYHSC